MYIAYLGRIVEYPSEVGIISECSLHTLYGIWDVGLGQRDDLDRHGIANTTTASTRCQLAQRADFNTRVLRLLALRTGCDSDMV